MRNKVKLIATAAVAAGAVSLGAAALAGGSSSWPPSPGANPNPGDLFFDNLSGICDAGASAIYEQVPGPFQGNISPAGAAGDFLANCLGTAAQ